MVTDLQTVFAVCIVLLVYQEWRHNRERLHWRQERLGLLARLGVGVAHETREPRTVWRSDEEEARLARERGLTQETWQ